MLEPRRKTNLTTPWQTRSVRRTLGYLLPRSRQSGFTVVEALMAIVVASALMVAIAPVIAMSVSARVQARRIDLATQAARSYVDALRANSLDPPTNTRARFNLDNLGVRAPTAMRPPQGVEQCLNKYLNPVNCYGADNLLVIQAFRDGVSDAKEAVAKGYCVGVRVYRADAFKGGAPSQTKLAQSSFLNSKSYPLVVMRTQIINQTNFEEYQKKYKKERDPVTGAPPDYNACND